jgi:hypothetical protein
MSNRRLVGVAGKELPGPAQGCTERPVPSPHRRGVWEDASVSRRRELAVELPEVLGRAAEAAQARRVFGEPVEREGLVLVRSAPS